MTDQAAVGSTSQQEQLLAALKAVLRGDLSTHLDEAQPGVVGEIAGTFNRFVSLQQEIVSEVMRITREVGVDGRLGGQAEIDGLSGSWKEMVDSVNTMGRNLTVQLRATSQAIHAVSSGQQLEPIGDMARSRSGTHPIVWGGEVLELRDQLNAIIAQQGAQSR